MKGKAAGVVGHDQVAVGQVAFVDGEMAAIEGSAFIDRARGRGFRTIEFGTREHQAAAGAGPVTVASAAFEAGLDILGPKVNQIESSNFPPAEAKAMG